jgi:hypothetical protein
MMAGQSDEDIINTALDTDGYLGNHPYRLVGVRLGRKPNVRLIRPGYRKVHKRANSWYL